MTTGAATGAGALERARDALARGERHLRALQAGEGYWWGELESNSTMTAEHVFMLHALGRLREEDRSGLVAELRVLLGPDAIAA